MQDMIASIEYPVLILSSKAGLGNYSVGTTLEKSLDKKKGVYHYPVEELLPDDIVSKDFLRYRLICEKISWVLYFIYRLPFIYWFKYKRECHRKRANLSRLCKTIVSTKAKTVIATNHRAAFWVSLAKKRQRFSFSLWAFLTDYYMNLGWKYIFWESVERFFAPIEARCIYPVAKSKYRRADIPVDQRYRGLPDRGDAGQVLITGGGWGLGNIFNVSKELTETLPGLTLHVVCGDNKRLRRALNKILPRSNIFIYGKVDSLYPLMEICGSVITKPGAVTITEAFFAGRQIFLLEGLPACEEKNMQYALGHFAAQIYSIASFLLWYNTYSGNKK